MVCSIGERDEAFNDEAENGHKLLLSEELLATIVRLEKLIHMARRTTGLSDDQKWRLVCSSSLVKVAGSHLKLFSGRNG